MRTIHDEELLESSRPFKIPWVAAGVGAAIHILRVDLSVHHTCIDVTVGDLDDEVHSGGLVSMR